MQGGRNSVKGVVVVVKHRAKWAADKRIRSLNMSTQSRMSRTSGGPFRNLQLRTLMPRMSD
jgi:hypothetical protein